MIVVILFLLICLAVSNIGSFLSEEGTFSGLNIVPALTTYLPLTLLLTPVTQINITMIEMFAFLLLFYFIEMLFVFLQIMTGKKDKKKEKMTERDIAFRIIEIFAIILIVLAVLFYGGTEVIDKKTSVQLVENQEYMISYCDGEHYVLHKVEYSGEKIVIYRNEQKIVGIENCEVSIKQIKEIGIRD